MTYFAVEHLYFNVTSSENFRYISENVALPLLVTRYKCNSRYVTCHCPYQIAFKDYTERHHITTWKITSIGRIFLQYITGSIMYTLWRLGKLSVAAEMWDVIQK